MENTKIKKASINTDVKGNDNEELQVKILDNTIRIFNEKGFKCTMDDVAKACGISKKTIYTVFEDKEVLFLRMVDYLFEGIKEAEDEIVNRTDLTLVEKIRGIMSVMPDSYLEIDFTKLSKLKEKYPLVYIKVTENLENGWESTIYLLNKAKEEGLIRKDACIPIIKAMLESTLEHFFQSEILSDNHISYQQGLNYAVDIIMDGILVKN